jgi:hypothetical protein
MGRKSMMALMIQALSLWTIGGQAQNIGETRSQPKEIANCRSNQSPLDAGVRDAESLPLGVALRRAARQRAHHRDVASFFGSVTQPTFEQSQLRALLAPFGDRARSS